MIQKRRARALRLLVVVALTVVAGRLFWLQAVQAGAIVARGEEYRVEKRTIAPVRGFIVDRQGRPLAASVPIYWVVANTYQMTPEDYGEVSEKLAGVLSVSQGDILAKLQANPSTGWLPLKRDLNWDQAEAVQKLKTQAGQPLPGITVEEHSTRTYPQGMLANHVIGFLNSEAQGAYGLEGCFDAELAGKPGEVMAEFTHGKTPIENTVRKEVAPEPGKTLVLTIDAALQQQVEERLDQVVQEYDAKRALGIAMNVHTGEILVMAMRPGADLNDRSTWGNPVDFDRINNWAVTPLSPGSIFKPITTAMALEEQAITLNTTFIDPGWMTIDDVTITNWDGYAPADAEPKTIAELLQRSSNVGMVQVGEKLGRDKFRRYLESFGFMKPTGSDICGDQAGVFGSPFEEKRDIDWANMYFGQHLEVTPLQMLVAHAAIANGGHLVRPHLVREIRTPGGQVVEAASTQYGRQVISETTAREVQQLMVSVVEKGTAAAAQVPGYTVGGKTGTGQKFENGRLKDRNLADFVGFAPASNPQVIMLVMVDEPVGEGYGGVLAAPIFADLLPDVMRTLGIPPDSAAAMGLEKAPPKVQSGVVPDVRWFPADWAKKRLQEAGLQAHLSGDGEVVASQSIGPGTTADPGTEVELTLQPRVGDEGTVTVPDFSGLSLVEASRLAGEVGLTAKAGGSGFVAGQTPEPGAQVPARSVVDLRLAPR